MTHREAGSRRRSLPWGWKLGLALGGAVLFALGLSLGIELAKPPPRPDLARITSHSPVRREPPPAPLPPPAVGTPLAVVRQPPPGGRPRIAVVIDDLGRSLEDVESLERLAIPLTYAVLPFEPHTPQVVAELRRRGAEYLCHLPMEAKGDADPGPGALTLAMSGSELEAATRRALAAVPGAVGVNNHMGSGISADRRSITAVLEVVAAERLYYLDSRTAADTLGFSVARQLGVPAGERQVFLDVERDPAFIQGQLEQLFQLAVERGGAIAIAHPYPETLAALRDGVTAARRRGIEFVPVSVLLDGAA